VRLVPTDLHQPPTNPRCSCQRREARKRHTIGLVPVNHERVHFSGLILWAAVAAALTFTLLLGGTFPGVFAPSFRIVDVQIAMITLLVWFAAARVRSEWSPASSLGLAIPVVLAVFLMCTLTSVMPRLSAEYFLYAIVLWSLYLLLVRLQNHQYVGPRIGSIAVALLVLIIIFYLRATLSTWQTWWSVVGQFTIPPLRPGFESLAFGNPSALGATVVLLFLAAVAHIGFGSGAQRAVVIGLSLVTLSVCLITGARSVWLGLLGLGLVFAVAWLASDARRRAFTAALRTTRGKVGVVAAVTASGLAAIVAGPGVLVRAGLADPFRPGYWLASLRMFEDRPLTGQGLGVWAVERASFTTAADLDFYIPHAHNIYLQTLAELGIVGLVGAIVLIGAVLRLLRRSLRGSAEQRAYACVAIGGIAYLAGHSLVDVVTNLPAVLLAFAIPISRLDALSQAGNSSHARRRQDGIHRTVSRLAAVTPAVFQVSSVAAALGLFAWTSVAVAHSSAVDAANRGDWVTALHGAERAVASDPDIPAYHVTLGLALARAGQTEAAIRELRMAAEADDWPHAWLDIAALHASLGDGSRAQDDLSRAERLGRQQSSLALQAAIQWAATGEPGQSIESLTAALRVAPSIANDPWWRAHPELAAVRRAALERAMDLGGIPGFRIALEVERLDKAATILDSMQSSDTTNLRLALAAWSGAATARSELEKRAADNPLDLETINWNAIVADHLDDGRARGRYRLWADLINGGSGSEAVGYRIVERLMPGEGPSGSYGPAYGQYLYLRPIPVDQVIEGYPQFVYR
jgi:O-antigen ligase/tetratricopeptide (TPR) repeat protein